MAVQTVNQTKEISVIRAGVLTLLGGVLLGLSVNEWHRFSFAFTAWAAFFPLFLALESRKTFLSHFVLSYLFASIYLTFALGTFLINSPLAGFFVILIGAVLFSFPLQLIFFLKNRIGLTRSFFAIAFLWPAYDYWIVEQLFGMPIYTLSICQASYPRLIQYIDITGYTGISTWIISLNIAIYALLHFIRTNKNSSGFKLFGNSKVLLKTGIILLHFALPLLYLGYSKLEYEPRLNKSVSVMAIQEEYPDPKSATDSSWVSIMQTYVTTTDSVIQNQKPDLILWPESAVAIQFKENKQVQEYLLSHVLKWETAVLSGSFDIEFFKEGAPIPPLQHYLNRNYEVFNAALLLTPQFAWNVLEGTITANDLNVYRKEHAMPFTEKVPLAETFPSLSNTAIQVGNLIHISTGKNEGLLKFLTKDNRITSVQPLICWDLLFTNPKSILKANPNFIAGLANETHFGKVLSTMPNGLVGYSIMRSIEYRRSIAKSSPMGFTFTTNPFGEITHSIPWLINGSLVSRVVLSNISSFYMRNPNFYTLGALFIFVLIVIKKP
ncbi:apolipoprotein N-acyltransferase [bacterium]|nr:MAG: apolipoprotein N-acyltransferase [bacterium]